MAELKMYATEADLGILLEWLNKEAEIAFIVSDGPRRWIAKPTLTALPGRRTTLWHVPSGALPLMRTEPWLRLTREPYDWVKDPWQGWMERRSGADPTQPWFGPGHPGILWLNTSPRSIHGGIGISNFEWIGNHYRIIGYPAHPTTEKWWQRLRRCVQKIAVRMPVGGEGSRYRLNAWAFPDAYEQFQRGETPSIHHW